MLHTGLPIFCPSLTLNTSPLHTIVIMLIIFPPPHTFAFSTFHSAENTFRLIMHHCFGRLFSFGRNHDPAGTRLRLELHDADALRAAGAEKVQTCDRRPVPAAQLHPDRDQGDQLGGAEGGHR